MKTFSLHPLHRKHIYFALALALFALVVRVVFLNFVSVSMLEAGDQRAYWTYAQGIAAGLGFHSSFEPYVAFRPPFYSYFLAGIFRVYGENVGAVLLIQATLGAAATYWFYLCIVRLIDENAALFGAICFALFPPFLLYTKQILTEALYIPLLVAFIAVLLIMDGKRFRFFKWLFVGFLLGILALTRREAAVPAGIILLAAVYFELRPHKSSIAMALALTGIVTVLILAPWLIRNWGVLGSPVFSTAGGANLMQGNNPYAAVGRADLPPDWQQQLDKVNEMGKDKLSWDLSFNWIQNNFGTFIALMPSRLVSLWGTDNNFAIDMSRILLIPFLLLGAWRLIRLKENQALIWIIVLSLFTPITFFSMIFNGLWRYGLVGYPGLFLLASCSFANPLPSPSFFKKRTKSPNELQLETTNG